MGDFSSTVRTATRGVVGPYPYQEQLARDGLPTLLRVPTGTGKTMAAVLPWLYRRRFHPDDAVKSETPRWLVFVLPMRVLVEQTVKSVNGWLENLGLQDEVGLHVLMGGESANDKEWRLHPERDAIFVGTLDMVLSRALNRGFGQSRSAWPIDFGLLHAGTQWVFDEIQLMGPALPTSRQLQGLRESFGVAAPTRSMWMSATVDIAALETPDNPRVESIVELSGADLAGTLARRIEATKTIRKVETETTTYLNDVAFAISKSHRNGELTLVIVNTVDTARKLHSALAGLLGDAERVLLHSRFRPGDRQIVVDRALRAVDANGPGRVVVSTQVVEAGVDISASVLFTEAAPWSSIVQRAGRCNRDGMADDAVLLWASPPKKSPYEEADLEESARALDSLEGEAITSLRLGSLDVPMTAHQPTVLRRRDLIGLFDTTADLGGNDIDIAPFIREADDLDVLVCWRNDDANPESPTRNELCPVPIVDLRKLLKSSKRGIAPRRFDHLANEWVDLRSGEVRAGLTVLFACRDGCYKPGSGWDPDSKTPVDPLPAEQGAATALVGVSEGMGDDPVTYAPGRWVKLVEHLNDVEREVRDLVAGFATLDLPEAQIEAAAVAGRLHDIGKAHQVFQHTLVDTEVDEDGHNQRWEDRPWAKSAGSPWSRHSRPHFRHELVSALVLLYNGDTVLEGVGERDLVTYLVAAHHGKVRLGIRSLPGESAPRDAPLGARIALGVVDGDLIPSIEVPGGRIEASTIRLDPMELGDDADGRPSWTSLALGLRDRRDIGPFRLSFLEALVRLADWRASASYEQPEPTS